MGASSTAGAVAEERVVGVGDRQLLSLPTPTFKLGSRSASPHGSRLSLVSSSSHYHLRN